MTTPRTNLSQQACPSTWLILVILPLTLAPQCSLRRDELPFLIDLHLFLSRPLKPAPVQGIREAAAAAEQLPPDTSLYGTFPQASV